MAYCPPFPVLPELMTMALLQHARERGLHDMSVRSLARAFRSAPGSLTYHYGTKDEMLATCARFLGSWLYTDLRDRLTTGGLRGLAPAPAGFWGADSDEELEENEYKVRWRLWIQLVAYGLSSPSVGPEVQFANERMVSLLEPYLGPDGVLVMEQALTAIKAFAVVSDVRED